jgi:hypothetical protein
VREVCFVKKSEIIIFETKDKEVTLSVPMDGDTVWLTQAQMAELFDTTKQNTIILMSSYP